MSSREFIQKLLLTVFLVLGGVVEAHAQLPPPNIFFVNTVIDPATVNANFALLAHALDRRNGIVTGTVTIPNTGLHLLDSDATHDLILAPGSNLTADRVLTIVTGDEARTLTLTGSAGSPTLGDWFDQSVKTTASPTFVTVTANLTGNVTGNLTGNSAGVHTGAVTGNLTGNVTGTVTGTLVGNVTGNAATATALQAARTIAGVSFDGTANIAIASTGLSDTAILARLNAATAAFTGDLTVAGTLTAQLIVTAGGGITTAFITSTGGTNFTTGTTQVGTLTGSATADSTSPTTGSWRTDGGLGVAKALWVGGLTNITGALTVNNDITLNSPGNAALTIKSLGTANYAQLLYYQGATPTWNVNTGPLATPALDWANAAGTTRMSLSQAGALRLNAYGAGTITSDASGNLTAVSDARMKDRISPLGYGLTEILALRPVQHGYTEASGLDREHLYGGFLAQDVQRVMPLAVQVDSRGYLTLADRPILGAAVTAIQQHDATLRQIAERIAQLEGVRR